MKIYKTKLCVADDMDRDRLLAEWHGQAGTRAAATGGGRRAAGAAEGVDWAEGALVDCCRTAQGQ